MYMYMYIIKCICKKEKGGIIHFSNGKSLRHGATAICISARYSFGGGGEGALRSICALIKECQKYHTAFMPCGKASISSSNECSTYSKTCIYIELVSERLGVRKRKHEWFAAAHQIQAFSSAEHLHKVNKIVMAQLL